MFESPRGTQRNFFDICTEERAFVTRGSDSPGRAGNGWKKNAKGVRGERRHETVSEVPGEPGQHTEGETRAELESRRTAARNGESGPWRDMAIPGT
ncbi:hypothetical protein NDU88_001609 [Pleurodeles waltl]|uniref:Uncharacterized protein n=1 Tax=Pleurodeles waltl TaxID=8319 RepID=A0AAV7MLH3_PLEWA|nr:hypothetical protein NDU88_001609 [Pleurodeles waltl]